MYIFRQIEQKDTHTDRQVTSEINTNLDIQTDRKINTQIDMTSEINTNLDIQIDKYLKVFAFPMSSLVW